ncbi:Cyclin, C-terminal domain [Dillenia turbinata]|uniref:Cyclin, C-terminal domain n=1 Tax=Dillenia turbinata TaxID=194707 RepID=A0AAN8VA59_9MAGN
MVLEEETFIQNPLDGLYCEEEKWDFDEDRERFDENKRNPELFTPAVLENDLFWEENELVCLISKERETISNEICSNGSLIVARKEAVEWILRVDAHYAFSALTTVLAVNYFDRFLSNLQFQKDKPWMIQLTAVACLSLAAKVEETYVPLLLDLQVRVLFCNLCVGDCKYLFEAKTIQRMELLVLSTLKWKMHPVTPLSYFEHIVRRIGLKTHLHWEFLRRCEHLLLSVIVDSRFVGYLPSVIASATMLHVIKVIEPYNHVEYQNQLMDVLDVNKDEVDEFYKFILELWVGSGSTENQPHKRKYQSKPSCPNGIFDASFSSDNSNDSWTVASSVSSSLEPLFKRSRASDQQMLSINCVSLNVLSSPY